VPQAGSDLSSRDAPTHVAMINLLYPRHGVPLELFYEYWSGGHTQISSRLPGIHQYFQHHLSYEEGAAWPAVAGVESGLAPEDRFYGDAEITFLSADDLDRFAAALSPLMDDEQNVFRKTISYQAPGTNARTYLDRIPDDSPNGDLAGLLKFMVYIRAPETLTVEDFRRVVQDEVAPALSSSPQVTKLRVRLPDVYDNDAVTLLAPNVSNHAPLEEQYQGVIEIAFSSALELRRFAESEEWASASAALAWASRAIHACRVLRTFTVYNHGRITTAGLRTPQVAEQIRRLGAINQLGDEVLDLVMGPHTQLGIKQAG
jgi:hypothetical protein